MRVLREAENPKRNFFLKMIKTIHKLLKDVPRAWKGTLNCLQVYFRSLSHSGHAKVHPDMRALREAEISKGNFFSENDKRRFPRPGGVSKRLTDVYMYMQMYFISRPRSRHAKLQLYREEGHLNNTKIISGHSVIVKLCSINSK